MKRSQHRHKARRKLKRAQRRGWFLIGDLPAMVRDYQREQIRRLGCGEYPKGFDEFKKEWMKTKAL